MHRQMRKAVLYSHGRRQRQSYHSPCARAAAPSSRTAAHAMVVRGRLQIHMYAHAHRPGVGEWRAGGAVLWKVAVLAFRRYAGARIGRVLHRQFTHACPRSGLAAPRRASRAPNETFLSRLGLPEHQRVGLVRRVSHPWYVFPLPLPFSLHSPPSTSYSASFPSIPRWGSSVIPFFIQFHPSIPI